MKKSLEVVAVCCLKLNKWKTDFHIFIDETENEIIQKAEKEARKLLKKKNNYVKLVCFDIEDAGNLEENKARIDSFIQDFWSKHIEELLEEAEAC